MTDVRQTRKTTEWTSTDYGHDAGQAGRTGHRESGWPLFAGALLVLAGAFQFIAGLTALLRSSYYQVGSNSLLVHVGYKPWGWTHIGVGGALVLIGLGIMARMSVARYLGVLVALIAAVVNIAFLPAFPLWGLINIALDVIVIYALSAHWRDWVSSTGFGRAGTADGHGSRSATGSSTTSQGQPQGPRQGEMHEPERTPGPRQ